MSRRIQILSLLLFLSKSASAWLNSNAKNVALTHRFSTTSPASGEAMTTGGLAYDAKKIRNFSIIAHIDHGA